MRIAFMGTPEFAARILIEIKEQHDIVCVHTRPDAVRGRGSKLVSSPVKRVALESGIPVREPRTLRDAGELAFLRSLAPDVVCVAAYGKILPQAVLDVPRFGCLNVHASLLPKYRGAAPIQHAIMAGETVTGITTMQMDAGLDTGDMLLWREVPIHADTTYGALHDTLMETGASLLVETLEQLAAGTLVRTPQTGESCYAGRITRETAVIDWSKTARELGAFVRGLNPTPYAQTSLDGAAYKIGALRRAGHATSAAAGTIVVADRKAGLIVAAGDEDVEITEIQAPGKKMMAARSFLNGCALPAGGRFSP